MRVSRFALRGHLAVVALTLGLCGEAWGFWSDELTTHNWDNTYSSSSLIYSPMEEKRDCGPDHYNRGVLIPGKLKGGWFEHRFVVRPSQFGFDVPGFFQGVTEEADPARFCPKTFNEYTFNHQHGVTSARVATFDGVVYSVYDSNSGYYSASKVKLMRDPSTVTSYPGNFANRRYSVADIARNPRNYIDLNPGSPAFITLQNANLTGPAAAFDADCATASGAVPGLSSEWYYGGYQVDRYWREHTGVDHENTHCGAPADLQTFDPDIDIRPVRSDISGPSPVAYVAWAERYVEGKAFNESTGTVEYGFDPLHPIERRYVNVGMSLRQIPMHERPLAVHVQKYNPNDLKQFDNGALPTTALTNGEQGINVDPSRSAVSPRVVAIDRAGTFAPVVAWAETDLSIDTNSVVSIATSTTKPLYVKVQEPGAPTTSAGFTLLGSSLGDVCNIRTVYSGRATGNKKVYTGTHDLAVMRYPLNTSPETPVVVALLRNASTGNCEVRVKVFNAGSWVDLGGNVNQQVGTMVNQAWSPRITVHENVPYITWSDVDNATWNTNTRVKRYNPSTSTFVELGGGAWAFSSDSISTAIGSSIAVTSLGGASTTTDDGAVVYVSALVNEPAGSPFIQGDAALGVFATTVRRCVVGKTAAGNSYECLRPPQLYTQHIDTLPIVVNGVANVRPAYMRNGLLGFGNGARERSNNQLPTNQLYGYTKDDVLALEQPGTDIVALGTNGAGDPSRMYASWIGPIQDHRESDRGLYVKRDDPSAASAALLAAGTGHTVYAPGNDGTILSWGDNSALQLGATTPATSAAPIKLTIANETVVKVAAGGKTSAALTASGKLYLWGANDAGQLCNGGTTNSAVPVQQSGTYADVAVGPAHVVALTADGKVVACGSNATANLGSGSNTPAQVTAWVPVVTSAGGPQLDDVVNVYAGGGHSCALRANRTAWCWGKNDAGQLGLNTSGASVAFAQVTSGSTRFTSLALGDRHSAGAGINLVLYTWGANNVGQLGLGDLVQRLLPTANTKALKDGDLIFATANNTYLINLLGVQSHNIGAYATGTNANGQLGSGLATPAQATTFTGIAQTYAYMNFSSGPSANHVFVVTHPSGDRYRLNNFCFGNNAFGQCGTGATSGNLLGLTAAINPARYACTAGLAYAYQRDTSGNESYGCGGVAQFAPIPAIGVVSARRLENPISIVSLAISTSSPQADSPLVVSFTGLAAGDRVVLAPQSAATSVQAQWQTIEPGATSVVFPRVPAGVTYVAYAQRENVDYFSPPFTTVAATPTLALDKPSYQDTSPVTVAFSGLENNAAGRIVIGYPGMLSPVWASKYLGEEGIVAGQVVFSALPAGTYVARAYKADGTLEVGSETAPFTVSGPNLAVTALDTTYDGSTPISITWSNITFTPGDYIAISPAGVSATWLPGDETAAYHYVVDENESMFTFPVNQPYGTPGNADLPNDLYVLRYMRWDEGVGYTVKKESGTFLIARPYTTSPPMLWTSAIDTPEPALTAFADGEALQTNLQYLPASANALLAILPVDTTSPTNFTAWSYLGSTMLAQQFISLPAGSYEARLLAPTTWNVLGTSAAFTVGTPPAPSVTTWGSYRVGDAIGVGFQGVPFGRDDVIAVAPFSPTGAPLNAYTSCVDLAGNLLSSCIKPLGEQAFSNVGPLGAQTLAPTALSVPGLSAGTFVARYLRADSGSLVAESAPFTMTTAGVHTSAPNYAVGADITVNWEGLNYESGDWINIVDVNAALDAGSDTFFYVSSGTGSHTFLANQPYNTPYNADLPRGSYVVRYMRFDTGVGYTVKDESPVFTVGFDPELPSVVATMTVTDTAGTATTTFAAGATVRIKFDHTPICSRAYVGIVPVSSDPAAETHNYTSYIGIGAAKTYKDFVGLPNGVYRARFYGCDAAGSAVVESVPFTIGTPPTANFTATQTGAGMATINFAGSVAPRGWGDWVEVAPVGSPLGTYASCNDINGVPTPNACYFGIGQTASGVPGGPYGDQYGASFTMQISGLPVGSYVLRYMKSQQTTLSAEMPEVPLTIAAAPATPTNVVATAGLGQINLSWTASPGATSYIVRRGTTQVGTPTGTTFVDTIADGTSNAYTVAAVGIGGTSAFSTAPAAPAVPAGLSAAAGNAQTTLTWTATAGATAYSIRKNGVQLATTTTNSYLATGLTNGTTYAFTVRAINAGGASAYTTAATLPAVPAGLTATTAVNGTAINVSLSWTATAGATGYYIKRNGTWLAATTTASYTDTAVSTATSYAYTIAAMNAGGTGTYTTAATVPAVPVGLAATIGNTQVSLAWTATSGATSYLIKRGGVLVGTSSTNSFISTGLTNGTAYAFTIAALNSGGRSADTAAVNATPAAGTPVYSAAGTLVSILGTASAPVAWPAHQVNDIGLLIVETLASNGAVATPAGWTQVTGSPAEVGGTTGTELTVFWKRAASGAETAPSVTATGDHAAAMIVTFRGCATTGNPWDGTVVSSAATGTALSFTGATTLGANRLVVLVGSRADDSAAASYAGWTNAGLTTLTERVDTGTVSGDGGGIGLATGTKAAAGAFAATTATLLTSAANVNLTIMLKP